MGHDEWRNTRRVSVIMSLLLLYNIDHGTLYHDRYSVGGGVIYYKL